MLCTASSFNPDLTVLDASSKNGFRWERQSKRKNHRQAATGPRLDVCRKSPPLITEIKELPPRTSHDDQCRVTDRRVFGPGLYGLGARLGITHSFRTVSS
jgi:hypothetical protein